MNREEKMCATCGRAIQWRRRWAERWPEIRYCSNRCRGAKPNALDREIEARLVDALSSTPRGQRIDPDEICAALGSGPRFEERVFHASRRLACRGLGELICDGRVVAPSDARRPFALSPPR